MNADQFLSANFSTLSLDKLRQMIYTLRLWEHNSLTFPRKVKLSFSSFLWVDTKSSFAISLSLIGTLRCLYRLHQDETSYANLVEGSMLRATYYLKILNKPPFWENENSHLFQAHTSHGMGEWKSKISKLIAYLLPQKKLITSPYVSSQS